MTIHARQQPESLKDLFFSFSRLAIQGFGGVLAYMEHELVEKKQWLTREEFIEEWAVARTMPGPAALNLSMMVGARYFGIRGVLAALAGMFLLPSILILLLALGYARFGDNSYVLGAIRGMGAVAAALFIATGLKLLTALKTNLLGVSVCSALVLLSFLGIVVFHWGVVNVLLGFGGLGCVLAYSKLRAQA